jgi:hypothetical protein
MYSARGKRVDAVAAFDRHAETKTARRAAHASLAENSVIGVTSLSERTGGVGSLARAGLGVVSSLFWAEKQGISVRYSETALSERPKTAVISMC